MESSELVLFLCGFSVGAGAGAGLGRPGGGRSRVGWLRPRWLRAEFGSCSLVKEGILLWVSAAGALPQPSCTVMIAMTRHTAIDTIH